MVLLGSPLDLAVVTILDGQVWVVGDHLNDTQGDISVKVFLYPCLPV